MSLGQKIVELKFPNRTSEFARITESEIANEQIIKNWRKLRKIFEIEENKIVFLNLK